MCITEEGAKERQLVKDKIFETLNKALSSSSSSSKPSSLAGAVLELTRAMLMLLFFVPLLGAAADTKVKVGWEWASCNMLSNINGIDRAENFCTLHLSKIPCEGREES